MLSSDEGEIDVFFDSADYLSSEESAVDEEIGSIHLEYGIWMNEPQSIKERRENFLRRIGLAEFSSPRICAEIGMEDSGLSEVMGLERLKQCSGAVSSSCISSTDLAEGNMVCCKRERGTQAKALFDELEGKQEDRQKQKVVLDGKATEYSTSAQEYVGSYGHAHLKEYKNLDLGKRRLKNWLNHFINKRKGSRDTLVTEVSKPNSSTPKINRMEVWQNNKRYMEFTALFNGQEIRAHNGLIWTMKFSPDGQYLASGGEDGVVRIWRVTSVDASDNYFMVRGSFGIKMNRGKSTLGGKSMNHASIVMPDKIFHIEESPVHEFHGHSSGVLDLSWSHSNFLLSSSKDKTVRLWTLGCTQCYNVFRHNDYVTCVQFNPVDDNYFISGSIDGKVRIWGVSEKRVVDWADVRDVITAICFNPDGNGFIVGSITGTCRFYDASGKHLKLNAQICLQGKKKTSANKITGIEFSQEISQRVMISAEDSKLHIFDGIDIICKYRGLPKSGSQMSASFTSSGKHIVSIGEDSRVYLWNYNGACIPESKQTKSVRSCEHFFSEGVTVAIPWSRSRAGWRGSGSGATESSQTLDLDSGHSSLGNWFSMDGSCWGSATWPEEKLPLCDVPVSEDESHDQHHSNAHKHRTISDMWGVVIVTAGCDGTIKTFHNYGLPIRF
ncbi:hypothetical protein I3843_03G123600 [Carya illinoinensis]|uniref:Uncharacterized protein n=1 Tax=Carya illinoinensis TaxID=32201 RepID=A0A922JUW6_CARIL|nr:hypothetical protein I3842_03G124000 [Carya illinoinensis]KAG6721672.1 hypothetical protein I3842_03G124000 [Carya illinoinensis]KAG6721673.1 hypothetical protein I3842_03G124000 [Carya illinoinensis]KAG6721674.1 hypothetical protein I3842_03G124000 [Carya illinoinensis]KAG6721675.1 hypothetical protein I3842_03G124000 [Carya illinoinensis]